MADHGKGADRFPLPHPAAYTAKMRVINSSLDVATPHPPVPYYVNGVGDRLRKMAKEYVYLPFNKQRQAIADRDQRRAERAGVAPGETVTTGQVRESCFN